MMTFAFEQIRLPLRMGNQVEAIKESTNMFDGSIPGEIEIPGDNHDWSAKMEEQLIVGSWAECRCKGLKKI
jgi:hypothetical protein